MDRHELRETVEADPFHSARERRWEADRPAPWTRPDGQQDPTVRFFWILMAAHLVVWTVLPTVTQPNLPQETLELLALGSQPDWGYRDHAPLPAWLAYGACALLGKTAWPAYLLSQLCTVTCLWAVWRMAREFLHPWTAVCVAVALEGCLFFSYSSSELSPYLFARCWWALAILTFYWALLGNLRRHWLATAVFLALGILSTYDTVLLLGAMILFTVWNERARQCWDSSRPILAMMLLGILLFPHGMWLLRHDFVTLPATMRGATGTAEGHLLNPLWFGLSQLAAFLPVMLLLAPLIKAIEFDEAEAVEPDREFLRSYLVWITLLPFLVMLGGSLVTGADLKGMWSGGLWTYSGLAVLLWSRLDEQRWNWRRSILFAGAVAGGLAAALVVTHQMLPTLLKRSSPVHFPGRALAEAVQKTWQTAYPDRSLPAVGGTTWLAGNDSWYGPQSPEVYADLDTKHSPRWNDARLLQSGGVVIWDPHDGRDWIGEIRSRFPKHTLLPQPVTLKPQTRAAVGEIQIAMAVIHPETARGSLQTTGLLSQPVESLSQSSPETQFSATESARGSTAWDSPTPANFMPPVPYSSSSPSSTPAAGSVSNAAGRESTPGTTIPASASSSIPSSSIPSSSIPSSSIPTRAQPQSAVPQIPALPQVPSSAIPSPAASGNSQNPPPFPATLNRGGSPNAGQSPARSVPTTIREN